MINQHTGRLNVVPLRWWERLLNISMEPAMRKISGLPKGSQESVQETHRWNNHHLSTEDITHLDPESMVLVEGHKNPSPGIREKLSGFLPWSQGALNHITIRGGPKEYIVIEPLFELGEKDWWHVGWISVTGKPIGVSRIRLFGPVRLLVCAGDVRFFGVNSKGEQLTVQEQENGRGEIGKTPIRHWRIPLL